MPMFWRFLEELLASCTRTWASHWGSHVYCPDRIYFAAFKARRWSHCPLREASVTQAVGRDFGLALQHRHLERGLKFSLVALYRRSFRIWLHSIAE